MTDSTREVLDRFRETLTRPTAPPPQVRMTILGEKTMVEAMFPGITDAFYPNNAIQIGPAKWHTTAWNSDRPADPAYPRTLKVELIMAPESMLGDADASAA